MLNTATNYSRETVISSVFRDSIAPPTMSLEEFGDIQKAEAEERSARYLPCPSPFPETILVKVA
jgi:hypothetical protein